MEQHSRNSLETTYSLKCYTFQFTHIATSASINKAITRENDFLPYVCVNPLLLTFGIGGSRTSVTFKMEFILKKSQQLEAYYCYKSSFL